jgi:xanthine dehydrogenase accessory factor
LTEGLSTTQPASPYPDWADFGLTDDVRPALRRARERSQPAALVTLIAADGGSPRPAGTQMLVTPDRLSGFLSGGCVEADVAAHGRAALEHGRSRRLVYGQGSPWPDIRLLCGARIELLVEPLAADDPAAAAWLSLYDRRKPAIWSTDGHDRQCHEAQGVNLRPEISTSWSPFQVSLSTPPQKRMIVVGGDPTSLAIARLAVDLGYETHLIRPRGPVTLPPNLAATYWRSNAQDAFADIGLDAWTFIAVATHDVALDEEALTAALASPAPYVGVLGARRRLPDRLERLKRRGVAGEQLRRLRGPIGLDLGGKSPFEIAVGVMAEATAMVHDAPISLRD